MNWLCKNCETNNSDDFITCMVCDEKSPEIFFFRSDSIEAELDTPVILEWEVKNVDSIVIDSLGKLNPKGKKEVYFDESSEIRLIAKNDIYTRVQSLHIELLPPKILSFTSSKEMIDPKEEIELFWDVKNFETITIFKIGDVTTKKGIKVKPLKSTDYVLTAINKSGAITEKISLKLPKPQIYSFEARFPVIGEEFENYLSWDIGFAEYIHISPEIGDVSHLKENKLSISPREPIKYTLTAGNDITSVNKAVFLDLPKLTIESFVADRGTVLAFSEVVLSWKTDYAKRISINNGIGTVEREGAVVAKIGDKDMEFTITVEGEFGLVKKEKITIKVLTVSSFKVVRDISDSSKIKLEWNCNSAKKILIDNEVGDVTGYSAVEIPSSDKRISYKLTAFLNEKEFIEETIELKPAVLGKFEVSSKYVFEGKLIDLEWSVVDAVDVFINNGVGKVEQIGNGKVLVKKGVKYLEITVIGQVNTIKKKIDLQYVKMPELKIIKIPQPAFHLHYDLQKMKPKLNSAGNTPMAMKRNFLWSNLGSKMSNISLFKFKFKSKEKELNDPFQKWIKLKKELFRKLKSGKY